MFWCAVEICSVRAVNLVHFLVYFFLEKVDDLFSVLRAAKKIKKVVNLFEEKSTPRENPGYVYVDTTRLFLTCVEQTNKQSRQNRLRFRR